MSHFTVIAITRQTSLKEFDAEAETEKLLEPFNEHTRTAPYPDACLCTEIEGIAKSSVEDYGAKGEPLASCDECEGLGTVLSTYNPASKWDWYEIGGRWEGELVEGYDASNDIRNYEKCNYCNGTGLRDDEIGNERRAEDPDWGCNGCHLSYAEGKAAKLSNGKPALGMKRKFENAPTGTNVALVKDIPKDFTAHAFVTPHFEWKQAGRMGWWAAVTEENDSYEQEWKAARKLYGDNVAVLIDCHI